MSEPRPKLPPTVKAASLSGEAVETHPSFGMISLTRWTSSGERHFFGSAVKPHAGIALSIHRGEKHRSMNDYWYHATDEIIQIDMTEAQFAQMITSFNIGGGVPCTISHVRRKALDGIPDGIVPECPEVNERKLVEHEFKLKMMDLARQVEALVAKAKAFQDKPTINKADRKEFFDLAESIKQFVINGVPFIQKQFNEALDDSVTQAKADVDGFVSNLLRQAGMEAIQSKMADFEVKLLPDDTGPKQLPPAA